MLCTTPPLSFWKGECHKYISVWRSNFDFSDYELKWLSKCLELNGAKHSPLTSRSGVPSGSFWIEVSNLGISDIQVRNLKTLHIEIDVGKIYIFLWRSNLDFRNYELKSLSKCLGSIHGDRLWASWQQTLKESQRRVLRTSPHSEGLKSECHKYDADSCQNGFRM